MSPNSVDIMKVSLFLWHLFKEKRLAVQTVKGYRSALASVFRHKNIDLSNDKDLQELIMSFEKEESLRQRTIPTPNWDLDIVLEALCQPPYEPLGEASFRAITKKCLFLLALATAKRVGEIHGVSRHVSFRDQDAILQYLPEFEPKTHSIALPIDRDFLVKSLKPLLGSNDIERLLCPVRCLKRYLKELRRFPLRLCNLWVGLQDHSRAMSKNGISFLLRETIRQTHASQPERDYPRGDIRVHSIRGVATSMNFMCNRSIESVMKAATWRGNSIFMAHYLKDVQRTYEHCSALGPIVAAGSIIEPRLRS